MNTLSFKVLDIMFSNANNSEKKEEVQNNFREIYKNIISKKSKYVIPESDSFGIRLIEFQIDIKDRLSLIFRFRNTPDNKALFENPENSYYKDILAWGKVIHYPSTPDEDFVIKAHGQRAILYSLRNVQGIHKIYFDKLFSSYYKSSLDAYMIAKVAETLPRKCLDIGKLKLSNPIKGKKNTCYTAILDSEKFIYKENLSEIKKTKLIESEPFFATCFRAFMGPDCVPEMWSVFQNNKRKGVLAKQLRDFESAFSKKTFGLDKKLLSGKGMVRLLVANFIFADIDAHSKNWGFNKNKNILRIDFDYAGFPKTATYHNAGPNLIFCKTSAPKKSFSITKENLMKFPEIVDGVPYNHFAEEFKKEAKLIQQDPICIREKWKYFLKAILIEKKQLQAFTDAHFISDKGKRRFLMFLNNRLAELQEVLLEIPDFKDFVMNNPKVIDELVPEYEEYNKAMSKEDENFKYDIDSIKANHQWVLKEIALEQKMVKP